MKRVPFSSRMSKDHGLLRIELRDGLVEALHAGDVHVVHAQDHVARADARGESGAVHRVPRKTPLDTLRAFFWSARHLLHGKAQLVHLGRLLLRLRVGGDLGLFLSLNSAIVTGMSRVLPERHTVSVVFEPGFMERMLRDRSAEPSTGPAVQLGDHVSHLDARLGRGRIGFHRAHGRAFGLRKAEALREIPRHVADRHADAPRASRGPSS